MRLCNRIVDSKDLSSYLVKLGRGIDGERISQFLECCLNGLPLLFYDQGWCSNLWWSVNQCLIQTGSHDLWANHIQKYTQHVKQQSQLSIVAILQSVSPYALRQQHRRLQTIYGSQWNHHIADSAETVETRLLFAAHTICHSCTFHYHLVCTSARRMLFFNLLARLGIKLISIYQECIKGKSLQLQYFTI